MKTLLDWLSILPLGFWLWFGGACSLLFLELLAACKSGGNADRWLETHPPSDPGEVDRINRMHRISGPNNSENFVHSVKASAAVRRACLKGILEKLNGRKS